MKKLSNAKLLDMEKYKVSGSRILGGDKCVTSNSNGAPDYYISGTNTDTGSAWDQDVSICDGHDSCPIIHSFNPSNPNVNDLDLDLNNLTTHSL